MDVLKNINVKYLFISPFYKYYGNKASFCKKLLTSINDAKKVFNADGVGSSSALVLRVFRKSSSQIRLIK